MRRHIEESTWAEIRTAYVSGIGLREIARKMRISEGTVLARAKREGWTQQIQSAKGLVKRQDATPTIAPFQAVAATLGELGKASRLSAARVHHRALTYAEILPGKELMQPSTSRAVKDHVQAAGLVHGWTEEHAQTQINVNVLGFAAIRPRDEGEAGSE